MGIISTERQTGTRESHLPSVLLQVTQSKGEIEIMGERGRDRPVEEAGKDGEG